MSRRQALAIAAVVLVAPLVAGAVWFARSGADTATADDTLRNFKEGTPPEELIARERAAGATGPIIVIEDRLPLPDDRPERYGPYDLVPHAWIGDLEEQVRLPEPALGPDAWKGSRSLDEIRKSDLWRDPTFLPDGLELLDAHSEALGYHVSVTYHNPAALTEGGTRYLEFTITRPLDRPIRIKTFNGDDPAMFEKTKVAGLPAVVRHTPGDARAPIVVRMLDETTGIQYVVFTLRIGVDDTIEIARGLYP